MRALASAGERWYALDPEGVASRLGVALDSGLSADEAAQRLSVMARTRSRWRSRRRRPLREHRPHDTAGG